MKKAILITGFNNWGKTFVINHGNLFNREKYYWGWTYQITGVNSQFIVENHSNDDYEGRGWINRLQERVDYVINNPKNPHHEWNLFTALCPSEESHNNFISLLQSSFFDDYEKHFFLLQNKWEHNAHLNVKNIQQKLNAIRNTTAYVVNHDTISMTPAQRLTAQTLFIKNQLQTIFP